MVVLLLLLLSLYKADGLKDMCLEKNAIRHLLQGKMLKDQNKILTLDYIACELPPRFQCIPNQCFSNISL